MQGVYERLFDLNGEPIEPAGPGEGLRPGQAQQGGSVLGRAVGRVAERVEIETDGVAGRVTTCTTEPAVVRLTAVVKQGLAPLNGARGLPAGLSSTQAFDLRSAILMIERVSEKASDVTAKVPAGSIAIPTGPSPTATTPSR